MYRVKPQAMTVVQRPSRAHTTPALLVASTAIAGGWLATRKPLECHNESGLQAQADHLKSHVQDFTDNVLDLSDTPYSTSVVSSHPAHSSGRYRNVHRHQHYRPGGPYIEEPLLPGLFYITLAGVTGSFLARKSNIVVRFLSPVALALGASAYCLPKTTNNVIHGVKTFNYQQLVDDWKYRANYAKQSVVDTTESIKSSLTSAVHGASDTAHELSDKTQELTDKTAKAFTEAKDKTVEVAHDLRDRTQDLAKDVSTDLQQKSKQVTNKLDAAKEKVKDNVEDKTEEAKDWFQAKGKAAEQSAQQWKDSAQEAGDQAKDWFKSKEKSMETSAQRWKDSAQEAGDQAKDWVESKGRSAEHQFKNWKDSAQEAGDQARDWAQSQANRHPPPKSMSDARRDAEQGFGRLKNDARQGWDNARQGWDRARGDFENTARGFQQEGEQRTAEWRRDFDRKKDQSQDWLQDQGQEMRRSYNKLRDQGQEWANDRGRSMRRDFENARDQSQDWARDRRRDWRQFKDEQEGIYDQAKNDARKREGEAWDYVDGQLRSAKHDLRDRAEDWQDRGQKQFRKLEKEWQGRAGAGENSRSEGGPRRSVTEAAREGRYWWPQQTRDAGDPYESYDRMDQQKASKSSSEPWWKAGGRPMENAAENFDRSKEHFKQGLGDVKESIDLKAERGREWFSDKSNDFKQKFEQGARQAEYDWQNKFGRRGGPGYESGNDMESRYGPGGNFQKFRDGHQHDHHHGHEHSHHNHEPSSVYSSDNWFHFDQAEEQHRTSAGRGRERGL